MLYMHSLRTALSRLWPALLAALLLSPTLTLAGDHAVSWSLDTPSGQTVNFPDTREGPAILLFWASWCPYCKALMPEVQKIAADYDGELAVYAINFRDDADPQAFMDKNGYTFTNLVEGAEVAEMYDIWGTPGVLIFTKDNQQVFNLYDLSGKFDEEMPEGLSNSEKAARLAPWWGEQIRAALESL